MTQKNLIIYTQGMKRRYLVEAVEVPTNIEAYLNNKDIDADLILRNVEGFYNFDNKGYKPNTPIDELAIKCGHIDLIAGTKEMDPLIYNNFHMPKGTSKIEVRFGLVPFSHGLVGELEFPANHIPEKSGQLAYVTKRLESKKFIPFDNPRQPKSPNKLNQRKSEYTNLFKQTQFENNVPDKILLNRTMYTVNSKAIWTPYEKR